MNKKEKVAILELSKKTDLLATKVECPYDGSKYIYGFPYVYVTCGKCGQTHREDFKQDIYTRKARYLLTLVAYNDKVIVRAEETYKAQFNDIRQDFIEQYCYDVSDVEDYNVEYRKCLSCGICLNCFTCKNCGKTFENDKNKRKQTCPHCRANNFVRTYFKKVIVSEDNREIKLCPFCKSSKIRMTKVKNKTKCHLCKTRKLTEKRIELWFQTTIERKKGYRRGSQ
jgi:DNA-directed RNA polymerase subunit RPC12/RpoP